MSATTAPATPRTKSVEPTVAVSLAPGMAILFAYAITVFVSAFLLFQVQPLISKFILPWFGGSPAVWTTAMLFFQVVLCAGYGYAHLISGRLGPRGQFLGHAVLLAVAGCVTLITRITPLESMKPSGAANEDPTWLILMLLLTTVGLPYFVLSSTGPLLQKWFSDAYPGTNPYRLFALSNVGSLAALISYPLLFEPRWDSHQQANAWSYGMAVFVALGAFCAFWTFRARMKVAQAAAGTTPKADTSPAPGWGLWIVWILLPALASVMFLAVTNEMCQNLATIPLLWIIPLSLYLISFIIAFDSPRWYSRTVYCLTALVFLVLMSEFSTVTDWLSIGLNAAYGYDEDHDKAFRLWTNVWLQAGVFFGGLAAVCSICHCEMARLRPSTKHLTAYFMTMSIGGAVGGILVNLVCPYVFTTFFELPLTMAVAAVVAGVFLAWPAATTPTDTAPSEAGLHRSGTGMMLRRYGGAALALGTLWIVVYGQMLGWEGNDPSAFSNTVHRARNFYGLVSVAHRSRYLDTPGDGANPDENYAFVSGHIMHGRQFARPEMRSRTDIAYWGPGTGCESAMRHVGQRPNCRIGIVGLGIGTIAGFAKDGDYVRAYEINPEVVKIARNTAWFTYLDDAEKRGAKVDTVLGDARLKLEYELRETGPHKFDVLCLDAFSGDAVPTHLITDEAFALYKQHLQPDGIIVVNITNTYLDLFPVVRQLADRHGYQWTRIYNKGDNDRLLYRTYFMLLTNDETFLAKTPPQIDDMHSGGKHAKFLVERHAPLWTDRFSSLLPIIQY